MSDETKRREEVRRSLISNHRCLGRKFTVYSEALRVIDALARECEQKDQRIALMGQTLIEYEAERDALKARVEDLELDKEHLQKQNLRCVAETERAEATVSALLGEVDRHVSLCETWQGMNPPSYTAMAPYKVKKLRAAYRAALADAAPTEEPNDGE